MIDNNALKGKTVAVFGGTGFIGRTTIQRLVKAGATVRLGYRNIKKVNIEQSLLDENKVIPIKFHLADYDTLMDVCHGADYVVNLVGIFYEFGVTNFEDVHVAGVHSIAKAAKESGAKRFVHISAMGSNIYTHAEYLVTKNQGEKLLQECFPECSILRPNAVYGLEDALINTFIDFVLDFPVVLLFGGGKAIWQPIYVGDVANAIIVCLTAPKVKGKVYELAGKEPYSVKEIMQLILKEASLTKPMVAVPFGVAKVMAFLMELMPTPILTRTHVKLMERDTVLHPDSLTVKDLGIKLTKFTDILPSYKRLKK